MATFKSRAARGTFRKRKYDVIMIVLAVLLPIVLVQIVTISIAEVDVSANDIFMSGTKQFICILHLFSYNT